MSNSRIKATIKNSGVAVGGQLANTVLSFISRTVFIYTLGKSYLGVHGLFSNILTVLSLAELGIGDAITYKLYKPLAEGNQDTVRKYLTFYKNAYVYIGFFVFLVGAALIPVLPFIMKDPGDLQNVRLIYMLYLFDTSSTYFFAHKKLILNADQKNYIITINRYIFLALRTALQITVLLLFKNFILYLVLQIVVNFAENVAVAIQSNKMYPYARKRGEKLDSTEKKAVFKQVSALLMHKIGGVCVSGTDNILISSFVGVSWVGLYSNYTTILTIPMGLLAHVFSPLTATVGNLISTSGKEHIVKTFNKLFLVNFWLYGFSAIALFVLIDPFISQVWLDESYLLSKAILFFIVLNFYLNGMRQVVTNFKYASGLFWEDRFRPLAESFVNLAMSIILLKHYGFIGVIIGTTIATLTTTFWLEAVIVYRKVLKLNPKVFFIRYVAYLLIAGIIGTLTYFACAAIPWHGLIGFIVKAMVCTLMVNLGFFIAFYRTEAFKSLRDQLLAGIFRKGGRV